MLNSFILHVLLFILSPNYYVPLFMNFQCTKDNNVQTKSHDIQEKHIYTCIIVNIL